MHFFAKEQHMRMRGLCAITLAAVVAGSVSMMGQMGGGAGGGPHSTLTQNRASPHDTINVRVGSGRGAPMVTIVYGRPYSKSPQGEMRKIWGTLVPWGKVWRLGSDEATLMVTQKALTFGDVTVPAGAYTLYMMPEENGPSKLIINKTIGQWGIPYTAELQGTELGRVEMKKEPLEKGVHQLTLALENVPGGGGAVLKVQWENTQYSVPFSVAK
jgi:hypothetical protein